VRYEKLRTLILYLVFVATATAIATDWAGVDGVRSRIAIILVIAGIATVPFLFAARR
jgi:hypothetical protein